MSVEAVIERYSGRVGMVRTSIKGVAQNGEVDIQTHPTAQGIVMVQVENNTGAIVLPGDSTFSVTIKKGTDAAGKQIDLNYIVFKNLAASAFTGKITIVFIS